MEELVRLNKFLSQAGICSRREADKLIILGKVRVNGKIIKEVGTKVQSDDKVEYGGKRIYSESKLYVLLNKPKDFICTLKDEKGRKTVTDLIKQVPKRVFPVGRLDRNTTGLLLLTNDGELSQNLSHPKFQVNKLYHVVLDRKVKKEHLDLVKNGVKLEDGIIKADEISHVINESEHNVGIAIHSGRNRIVRRIFEHLGYKVTKLDRVVYAQLTKKDLPRGKWRYLNKQEVKLLKGLKSKV